MDFIVYDLFVVLEATSPGEFHKATSACFTYGEVGYRVTVLMMCNGVRDRVRRGRPV